MKRIILLLIPVLLVFSSIQNIYANPTELPVRKENTKLLHLVAIHGSQD